MSVKTDTRVAEFGERAEGLARLAEAADLHFWLMDLDPPRLVYASPATRRAWGLALEGDVAREVAAVRVHADDLTVYAALFSASQGAAREGEYRIYGPQGDVRWMHSRVFPIRDAEGAVCRLAGFTEDVTERRIAHEELLFRRASERLITSLSTAFVGVSARSMDSAFNAALGDLAIVMGAQGAGISLLDEISSTSRLAWYWREPGRAYVRRELPISNDRSLWRLVADMDVLEIGAVEDLPADVGAEREWLLESGSRSLIAAPLRAHGKLLGLLAFDACTPHKIWPAQMPKLMRIAAEMFVNAIQRVRAEESMRAHRDRLAHVLRLGTMGQLASGIAHELNQPLSAILSYARGCERRLDAMGVEFRDIRDALKNIGDQAVRAADVITTLRALVKGESRRDHQDLDGLVRGALQLVQSERAEAGVDIEIVASPEPLWVQVDTAQIEQVILNLVRNGFEAMRSCAVREMRIEATRGSRTAELAVSDTGPGLDAETATLVFDDFYTTKPEGLGLGLSISRSIIEAHGGKIWLDRSTARGACFRFAIPLSGADALANRG